MAALRIIVTGGLGFVGSAIISALKEQIPTCSILVLDKGINSSYDPKELGTQFQQVDLTNASEVKRIFRDIDADIVIHTAGYVPPLNVRYTRAQESLTRSINVEGTRNVLNAARDAGCKAFVYTSSCCAVTDDLTGYFANIDERWPVSRKSLPYGESKVEAEEFVLQANTPSFNTCVLRPAVIFGEGDYQLVPAIHACIAKGEALFRLGDGENLWDVAYVGNVADAHVLAVENLLSTRSAAGEVFFIQQNEPITFREFCLAIWREFDYFPPFEVYIPKSLGWTVGLVAECWTWLSGLRTTISRGSVLGQQFH